MSPNAFGYLGCIAVILKNLFPERPLYLYILLSLTFMLMCVNVKCFWQHNSTCDANELIVILKTDRPRDTLTNTSGAHSYSYLPL